MAEASVNGPTPSNFIFIHQIPDQKANAKVRFLCCVTDYDERTGRLTVEHDYPRDTSRSHLKKVAVDVNLILETTNMEVLQAGSWINVVGYVVSNLATKPRQTETRRDNARAELPIVQAVLVWSAGAIHVDKYEKTLEDHLARGDG